MNKRATLVAATLLAGLVAAVIGATAALQLIGSGALGPGGKALSEADIRNAMAQPPPAGPGQGPATSAAPGRSTSTPPSAAKSPGTTPAATPYSYLGNVVFASCSAGAVTITGQIPAGGYGTDGSSPGPAPAAWVRFKSASAEITVTATCVNGQPSFATSADDQHGGGHGGGGGGSGGGH